MHESRSLLLFAVAGACLLVLCAAGGCSGQGSPSGFSTQPGANGSGGDPGSGSDDSGAGGSSSGGASSGSSGSFGCLSCNDAGPPPPPCTGGGLNCYVPSCPNGGTTSLSGTVYDPAGLNPLYNVVVFVPNDPLGKLPAIKTGTSSCNTCDVSIGNYIAVTTTDAKGHFTLKGVPATTHVPIVVQTGKWRRETFLSSVAACKDNAVPAANSRLPRNHMEGDMPQMFVMTGGCDDLGCFMQGIGIDASEFSAPHAGGRLDVYTGQAYAGGWGAATLSSGGGGTWGTPAFTKQSYEYYDIALFSCECGEHQESAAGRQALHDWLNEGGKVFASHYNYTWFSQGPADFQGTATWLGMSSALGRGAFTIDTSFPKGQVFEQWADNVGAASGSAIGLQSVARSVSSVNPPTTRWIYDGSNNDVKYLSFLTPIGGIPASADAGENHGPTYCGKAVFTDLHTGSSLYAQSRTVPAGCTTGPLTPQQKALEFLLFDLSACVAPDNVPPPPPPPPMMTVQ